STAAANAAPPGDQPAAEAASSPPAAEPAAGGPTGAAAASAGIEVPTTILGQAIAELQQAQPAEHHRLLRLAAEYENYKKRSRKEQTEAVRRAEEKTIQELLPVIDNLERALSHAEAPEAGAKPSGLLEGVGMVHKQFLSALDRFGIKPFDSVGQ